jgi:anti-sigma regulatory factor (Ser/Thr protein kinase)
VTKARSAWSRPVARSVEFPFVLESVGAARHAVAAELAAARVPMAESSDVLIILSELMGNSVRHARPLDNGCVRVLWRVHPDEVEVAVADGGAPTLPRAEWPPFAALSGRGLGIVDTLSETWGVEGAGTHNQLVWAVVPLPGVPVAQG